MNTDSSSHPSRWKRKSAVPKATSGAWSQAGIWLGLILAWILLAAFIFILPRGGKGLGEISAPPSLEGVRAVLAIVAAPSPEFLSELETAHQRGVKVQLVTADAVQAPYKVFTVSKERILRNGILLDGVAWYPLP
ncbi:MAG: hypothetical protein V1746_07510 [bacterium]